MLRNSLPRAARAVLTALALVPGTPGRALASPAPVPAAIAAGIASIPPRDAQAPTGSELVARLSSLSPEERGKVLLDELLKGNVPDFLRQMRPVEVSLPRPAGTSVRAVFWVTPDYLAVGSDADFVRVPLGLGEALTVARRFGCTLPTRKMVDRIYSQAERKVEPQPMPPGPAMTSVAYFWAHNRSIEEQLRGLPLGTLVSGDKKDLVLTRRLAERPGKVAIYGWHRRDGRPIQPLSTVHEAAYADYSHGIRLVGDTVLVDGQPHSVFDLLEDPALVDLLSDEGVDHNARRVLGSPLASRAEPPAAELHASLAR